MGVISPRVTTWRTMLTQVGSTYFNFLTIIKYSSPILQWRVENMRLKLCLKLTVRASLISLDTCGYPNVNGLR